MENIIEFDKNRLISELKGFHDKLVKVYNKIFQIKYSEDTSFQKFIDKEYADNNILEREKEDWNLKFCHKSAYTLLNKVLFIRICEDMGFMLGDEDKYKDGTPKNINAGTKLTSIGYQKWADLITNNTLSELLQLAFKDMSKSYPNIALFKENKYEKLNFNKNDLEEKFFYNNSKNKIVEEFEEVLKEIIQKLDVSRYNFNEAVKTNVLGDVYEKFMDRDTRKALGQFYTPDFIIDYILENTVEEVNVVENPFVKVLDPACGSGHFLIKAYDILRKKFSDNLEILREKYGNESYEIKRKNKIQKVTGKEYWQDKYIHYHILKHCIYGADIDDFAVQLTTINLLLKDFENVSDELNIIQCDSLVKWEEDYNWEDLNEQLRDIKISYKIKHHNFNNVFCEYLLDRNRAEELICKCKFWNTKFDYIVGNPPYVGHKQLTMEYKQWLLGNYTEVFKDKSDIAYCFFYRSLSVVSECGKISLITSRYFMESPTGKSLRIFLKNNSNLLKIVDFYGAEIFKGVGIATAIYIYTKKKNMDNHIEVYKLIKDNYDFDNVTNLDMIMNTGIFEKFDLKQSILESDRWILIPENKYIIYKKIENNCDFYLNDLVVSFQGIITGCDKAFVLKDNTISKYKIESSLLRKWIKNSNVNRYNITNSNLSIIYSDLIENESNYTNSISYIGKYRGKLENRRECKIGVRKWYQLQWGRDIKLFDGEKVVYPYKSKHNRFAVDKSGSLCSADVYSFSLNNNSQYTTECLVGILNSKIYEFYFKLFAKKMGTGVYDYYPNSVLYLKLPNISKCKEIDIFSKKIFQLINQLDRLNINYLFKDNNLLQNYYNMKFKTSKIICQIYNLEEKINKTLACLYGISESELMFIYRELGFSTLDNLEKRLTKEMFYKLHIVENKRLEDIADKYSTDIMALELVRSDYIEEDGEYKKYYNLSELYDKIYEYLKNVSIEILQSLNSYISLKKLKDILADRCDNFNELLNVLRNKDASISSLQMVKDALDDYSETWNSYWKKRNADKETLDIIKYDTSTYGLASWSDEIHKEYFLNAVNEYTGDKPNKKKAEEILNTIKKLDIDDKEEYISVIQKKVDKAFNRR